MNRVVRNWSATANYDLQTAEAMYKAGKDDQVAQATAEIKRIVSRDTATMSQYLVRRRIFFGSTSFFSEVKMMILGPE
jgi:cobalamin biosynthesis protein CobD/CbiB